MAKPIPNKTYDKIKLAHELSCLAWFIKHHAIKNEKTLKHKKVLQDLEKSLNDYVNKLVDML